MQIVSKQLHNKRENNTVIATEFINNQTISILAVKQLPLNLVQILFSFDSFNAV